MGNQSEENGGWQYGCLGFFVILCIIGGISNLFDSCNGSSYKTDFSIKSLFSKRAYKTYWNRNIFVIELPYPTKGLVGINEVSWGKVDVDELIEDIYDEIKNSDYSQCLICVSFITKYKNQYGDDVEEKQT